MVPRSAPCLGSPVSVGPRTGLRPSQPGDPPGVVLSRERVRTASPAASWIGAQESLSEDLGAHSGVLMSVGVVVTCMRFAFVYIELSEVTFCLLRNFLDQR